MALRKSFSGDRDRAVLYLGLAQARLTILKNVMRLGGLQQLQRTFSLPGGVVVMVASVFGQDYISIDVPVKEQPHRLPDQTVVEAQETSFTEYDAEKIASSLKKTFADTIRSYGSGVIEVTHVVENPPLIVLAGDTIVNGVIHAARWRSDSGLSVLRIYSGYRGSHATNMSTDIGGNEVYGAGLLQAAVLSNTGHLVDTIPHLWSGGGYPTGPKVSYDGELHGRTSTLCGHLFDGSPKPYFTWDGHDGGQVVPQSYFSIPNPRTSHNGYSISGGSILTPTGSYISVPLSPVAINVQLNGYTTTVSTIAFSG